MEASAEDAEPRVRTYTGCLKTQNDNLEEPFSWIYFGRWRHMLVGALGRVSDRLSGLVWSTVSVLVACSCSGGEGSLAAA